MKNISIADAELPIMKVLWEKGTITSPEIFKDMEGNKSTLKTLLQRLVTKGAVSVDETSPRAYLYTAVLSESEYVSTQSKSFVEKVFDGNINKMLLNFIKEEKVTKEEIQHLLDLADGE